MNQIKLTLFNNLKIVFPQPHLMRKPLSRATWAVALYVSKAPSEYKTYLKEIGNTTLAREFIEWMKKE